MKIHLTLLHLFIITVAVNVGDGFRYEGIQNHCPDAKHHKNVDYNSPYPPYHQVCYVRQEIIEIVNYLNFTTGADIGVQKGSFSEIVLGIWTKAKSYSLVDIWRQQNANYSDGANVADDQQEINYAETKSKTSKFGSVPKYFRNYSMDAATYFEDNSLDFIYIGKSTFLIRIGYNL